MLVAARVRVSNMFACVGQRARAILSRDLSSDAVFDDFTTTINRDVGKSLARAIGRHILQVFLGHTPIHPYSKRAHTPTHPYPYINTSMHPYTHTFVHPHTHIPINPLPMIHTPPNANLILGKRWVVGVGVGRGGHTYVCCASMLSAG